MEYLVILKSHELKIFKKLYHEKIVQQLAQLLNVDVPMSIRLGPTVVPPHVTSIKRNATLQELIGYTNGPLVLYYDVLDFSLSELETKRFVDVEFIRKEMRL